jgi:hypothetical protein
MLINRIFLSIVKDSLISSTIFWYLKKTIKKIATFVQTIYLMLKLPRYHDVYTSTLNEDLTLKNPC